MNYQQYFKGFFAGALLLALLIVVFNLLIDPVDAFRIIKIPHINLYKTKYDNLSRFGKPLQVELLKPERVAIGSSRVILGIPMEHSSWNQGLGQNMGVSSASMHAVDVLFEHTTEVSAIRDALISTDLYMFNANQQPLYPHPLAKENESREARWLRRAATLEGALFSPNITLASLQTLVKQGERHNKFLASGQANPEHEKARSVHDGYKRRFLEFEYSLVRLSWSSCKDNQLPFAINGKSTFDNIDHILRIAASKKVRVRFFISPIHARLLESMSAAGFWERFEDMKVELVDRVERAQRQYPELDVQVWDFSGYNPYSTEPIPTDPNVAMQWYYDSSHFSDALGRIMEDNIYLASPPQPFGLRLTSQNIKAHLEKLRREQQHYREQNRAQYNEIEARVRELLEEKKQNGADCPAIKNA